MFYKIKEYLINLNEVQYASIAKTMSFHYVSFKLKDDEKALNIFVESEKEAEDIIFDIYVFTKEPK